MVDSQNQSSSRDLISITLAVLFIACFIVGSFWILRPFLFAFLWATLIVIPTWPLMQSACDRFGGRRGIAVALFTIALLLLVVIPLWLAFSAVVEQREVLASWIRSLATQELPLPPTWLADVPFVGERLAGRWLEVSQTDRQELMGKVVPYLQSVLGWFVSQIGSAGVLFVHFLLTVVLAAVLFMRGEAFADGVRRFARRLGGERGAQVTILAAQAVKAVAMGVVVTALLQAVLSALALWIVGIPYPVMLAAIILFLAIVQIGAGLILLPAIGWLFWNGQVAWAIVLIVFSVIIMSIDNVLRPLLIKRGANLPLLLIFAGVIGGLFAFGIIGLFIGPTVLAVSYTLLTAWINEIPHPEEQRHSEP